MADPILFQAFPLSDWPWGGIAGDLYIFDDQQWTDQNGMPHLGNNAENFGEPVQICPVLVNGRVSVVEDFYYQPTLLSIDRPQARRSGVIVDANGDFKYTLFRGAIFP